MEKPMEEGMGMEHDQITMKEFGYDQVLYRGFNGFMNFALNMNSVSPMVGPSILWGYGLQTGGGPVMIWGLFVCGFAVTAAAASLAEVCSVYPFAGSVYNWSAQLLQDRERGRVASYVAGYLNFIGFLANSASIAYSLATAIATLLEFKMIFLSTGVQVAIAISALALWAGLSLFRVDKIGWINQVATAFQLVSFIIVMAMLSLYAGPRPTVEEVFFQINNDTGFNSNVYVALIGLLFGIWTMQGWDAGSHLAEETINTSVVTPTAMVGTVVASWVLSLSYTIALLFATHDVEAAVGSSNATIQVYTSIGQIQGTIMSVFLIVNLFSAGYSALLVSVRIAFAMARDRGFVFSDYFSKVHPTTREPVRLVVGIFFVCSLFVLLPLIGTMIIFNAVTALAAIGASLSYSTALVLRAMVGSDFATADFSLGKFGTLAALLGAFWFIGTSIFLFLPTQYPVTAANFNYSVAMLLLVMMVAAIYWFTYANKKFLGPKRKEDFGMTVVHSSWDHTVSDEDNAAIYSK